jgi:ribosomal protein L16 Arg81 hydroxylase
MAETLLRSLLSPISPKEFIGDYYEKKHLHIPSDDHHKFDDIMTGSTIDEVLENYALSIPLTRMAKKDADLEADEYTLEGSSTIDTVKVAKQFADGATLILSSLQFRVASLKKYCDQLSRELGQRIQTNIYCTPGDNSQGFLVHHDTHDVIILQVEGSKSWKIYDSPVELAVKDQQFYKDKYDHGDVIDSFIMNPGDLLYIPRGLMHAAVTESDRSVHVTTGLMGDTLQDLVVDEVNRLVLSDPRFRRGLTPEYWTGNMNISRLKEGYEALIKTLSQEGYLEGILQEAHKKFVATYQPSMPAPLKNNQDRSHLNVDSVIQYERTLPYHIEEGKEQLTLYMCNRELQLPLELMPVIEELAKKSQLKVSEIPLLDSESQLPFADTLIEFGFLRIVKL